MRRRVDLLRFSSLLDAGLIDSCLACDRSASLKKKRARVPTATHTSRCLARTRPASSPERQELVQLEPRHRTDAKWKVTGGRLPSSMQPRSATNKPDFLLDSSASVQKRTRLLVRSRRSGGPKTSVNWQSELVLSLSLSASSSPLPLQQPKSQRPPDLCPSLDNELF